jgi:hypothetical protein
MQVAASLFVLWLTHSKTPQPTASSGKKPTDSSRKLLRDEDPFRTKAVDAT